MNQIKYYSGHLSCPNSWKEPNATSGWNSLEFWFLLLLSGFLWYFLYSLWDLLQFLWLWPKFNSIINKLSLIDQPLLFVFDLAKKLLVLLNLKSLRSETSWFLWACEKFWCLNLLVFQDFSRLFIVFYFVAKTRHIERWLIPFISKNSLRAVKKLEFYTSHVAVCSWIQHFIIIFT